MVAITRFALLMGSTSTDWLPGGELSFYVKERCHGRSQENAQVTERPPTCHLSPTSVMEIARSKYTGLSRKLVIALDIGTTFCGAAYALLDPGEVPEVKPVTR